MRLRRATRWDIFRTAFYGTAITAIVATTPYDMFTSEWELRWLTDGLASAVGLRTHDWLPFLVKLLVTHTMLACTVTYYSLLIYLHTYTNVSAEMNLTIAEAMEVVPHT